MDHPSFGIMMDEIINLLLTSAEDSIDEKDEDETENMQSQLKYLQNCSPQEAKSLIGQKNEKLATDFSDNFGAKHENDAMEIMLKVCIKILNMRYCMCVDLYFTNIAIS